DGEWLEFQNMSVNGDKYPVVVAYPNTLFASAIDWLGSLYRFLLMHWHNSKNTSVTLLPCSSSRKRLSRSSCSCPRTSLSAIRKMHITSRN
ncbi:MAG: hypothetical protein K8R13_10770, partial [Methanococcoides sp.]|nr:hypothetical protein [Methanococcoides sp.]